MRRRVARAVIHDTTRNRYLVIQNWPHFGGNTFALVGGGIHRGEAPKDAVLREMKEEVGIGEVYVKQITKKGVHQGFAGLPLFLPTESHVFEIAVALPSPDLHCNWEISKYQWVPWHELNDVLDAYSKKVLNAIRSDTLA